MSQHAQPVPPPAPAGVIVCAPGPAPAGAAPAPAAPQQPPPQAAGQHQLCGAEACGASPPAGPSPPSLPSPPQLCASLNAQDCPLDLSAATTANGRSQEPIQKVKVEQAKQEEQHIPDQGSNILRSHLNTRREVKAMPIPDREITEYDDSDPTVKEPERKRWKPDSALQYPQHTPQRSTAAVSPGSGSSYQGIPQPASGYIYGEKGHPHFHHQGIPLSTVPRRQAFSPLTYTTLAPGNPIQPVRQGYMGPIHVQIPGYHHGPAHKTLPAPYSADCSPLQNPQQGSAFTRHVRPAGSVPSREQNGRTANCQPTWTLLGDGELKKPEALSASVLMQRHSGSTTPPLAPPLMAGYSPNHPHALALHTSQVAPLPHWASNNWMASTPRPLQYATLPEASSAEAGVEAPTNRMPQALQSQGKNVRPFKTFNYEEHLGEPVTHESKIGKLPFDTRENYERFLKEKRALIPLPSMDPKAGKNAQSPEGEHPSSTEENAEVAAYKARRQKNNLAAKRSRAARHVKEDNIAITSMYLCEVIKDYRHALGVQILIVQQLERQLAALYFRQ